MKIKYCGKCKQNKPRECFWNDSSTKDGKRPACIECLTKPEERQKSTKRYKRWRENNYDLAKARARSYETKGREKFKLEHTARDAVNGAIRYGRMVRLPCRICGNPESEAHHADYTKPLEVEWLCVQHHKALHHEQQENNN